MSKMEFLDPQKAKKLKKQKWKQCCGTPCTIRSCSRADTFLSHKRCRWVTPACLSLCTARTPYLGTLWQLAGWCHEIFHEKCDMSSPHCTQSVLICLLVRGQYPRCPSSPLSVQNILYCEHKVLTISVQGPGQLTMSLFLTLSHTVGSSKHQKGRYYF